MVKTDASAGKKKDLIHIEIDEIEYEIPNGYTISTAVTYAVGLNYRTSVGGNEKGPICNMGTCYECSVWLEGTGNTRACMMKAKEGMRIKTSFPEHDKTVNNRGNSTVEKELLSPYDVAIIGAGPGGLGAADELAEKGIQVILIDEQQQAGGQIYRQSFDSPNFALPVNPLVEKVQNQSSLNTHFGASIWSVISINSDGEICTSPTEHHRYRIYLDDNTVIEATYLIVSTGAYDRMIPFEGWDKAGVMSAGGIQISAKTQKFVPGESIFLAGSHPFLLIVAGNIIKSGGTIKGIAFSQSFPKWNELLGYGLEGMKKWKKSLELAAALKLIQKEKVPLYFNTLPIKASGNSRVENLTIGKCDGEGNIHSSTIKNIACDTVGICYGFNASSELARQMQCKSYYDEVNGGWLIETDEYMKTSQPNVYATGEITGVGGAELSEIEGRIAGLNILSEIQNTPTRSSKMVKLVSERKSWTKFAQMLGAATYVDKNYVHLLEQAPKTIICKCEEITAEDIKETLESNPHLSSLNSIKLMTRCGMGLCQGRYCERSLMEYAEKLAGKQLNHESFSSRYPLKPVSIGSFKK